MPARLFRSDESREEAIELMVIKERKELEIAAEKAKQDQ